MSYGKAMVGSIHGGMSDLLDDGKCGLLYTPPDETQPAQHIVFLLQNKNLRDELGEKVRTRALEHFNSEQVMHLTEIFYHQTIPDCLERSKKNRLLSFGNNPILDMQKVRA